MPGEGGHRGHVKAGQVTLTCALGRTGVKRTKREGDEATPAGTLRILFGFYRPDRLRRPFSRVRLKPLPQNLGWCDDPRSPAYNRPGPLPMRDAHEVMWREDGLYDVVLVLNYNLHPRQAARGSAIFLHCAKGASGSGLQPTLGCVALTSDDMRRLLLRLAGNAKVRVVS